MKRSTLVKIHLGATAVATITILSFFSFSLIAEIMGDKNFIEEVKTGILYCLPLLLISMPILGITGSKLGENINLPLVQKKMKRMKFIALNGTILIGLAIYLFYLSNYETIDSYFLIFQIAELFFGAVNLILISLNIKDGLTISGKR